MQDSCWSILQAEDIRNGELFVTYYVGFAFSWDQFHRHFPSSFKFDENVVLLSPQYKKNGRFTTLHMTRQLWCRGTDMACAKSIVIRWSRIWIQRNILNYIWITGKTVSEMTPLPLFVVRYGIIHIYTRYNLALKAAASLKSEMCTLWFENACQSGSSEAKSNETFRDRDVFVVHFAVVVFRPRYANYLLYSTCLLINTRWYIEYKTIDVITYPYTHSSRKKIPSYVHGRCLVISRNFVPVNSIHMLYHFFASLISKW